MRKNKIIYSLTVEDLQTVASQEIGRSLKDSEIEKIQENISEKINWYDAILDTIYFNLNIPLNDEQY